MRSAHWPELPVVARRDAAWCLRTNHWCAHRGVRAVFALASRLGDGIACYALMAGMVVLDGWQGLFAAAHLAATGLVALGLYRSLKRWTKRPRPCASSCRARLLRCQRRSESALKSPI